MLYTITNPRPSPGTSSPMLAGFNLPTVNTSTFWDDLPNRVCIARTAPTDIVLPKVAILAPSRELLTRWHQSNRSDADWNDYTRRFWSEVARRCKSSESIWNGARNLLAGGLDADVRGACLAFIMATAARRMGVIEVTLCCYESAANPHCHRWLIYHAMPEIMRGIRS